MDRELGEIEFESSKENVFGIPVILKRSLEARFSTFWTKISHSIWL